MSDLVSMVVASSKLEVAGVKMGVVRLDSIPLSLADVLGVAAGEMLYGRDFLRGAELRPVLFNPNGSECLISDLRTLLTVDTLSSLLPAM